MRNLSFCSGKESAARQSSGKRGFSSQPNPAKSCAHSAVSEGCAGRPRSPHNSSRKSEPAFWSSLFRPSSGERTRHSQRSSPERRNMPLATSRADQRLPGVSPIKRVGFPPKFVGDAIGACVAGQIELPDGVELDRSIILQEGVLPSPLAPLLPVFFIAGGRLLGAAQSLIKGVYQGPLSHLHTFFVVSHDDAGGRRPGRARRRLRRFLPRLPLPRPRDRR